MFHVHPFGYTELHPERNGIALLPAYDNQGELYLGLANALPGRTISILFQMAEDSGDPRVDNPAMTWSVLDHAGWTNINDRVRQDTTRGFTNSGVVEIALPDARPDGRLPLGYYWLGAAARSNTAAVCDMVAARANAALASLVAEGVAPDHFAAPLPAMTITRVLDPLPEIATVSQPYPSFGARAAETPEIFYTRISERLRHKGRAVTPWDYERLVLAKFPELHRVKCLRADPGAAQDRRAVVRVIIIVDVRRQMSASRFAPLASKKLCSDVAAYLAELTPPMVKVEVANPNFVQVRVRMGVRFRDSGNEALCKRNLSEDIVRFLSPWAGDGGGEITFNRRIYANSLVAFASERPYVAFVAGIKLFWDRDGRGTFTRVPQVGVDGYYACPDSPDQILVSASRHDIDTIHDDIYRPETFGGIGYMKIELDFRVG